MITISKKGIAMARFGYGMICITPKATLDKKVYLDLQPCSKSKIGADLENLKIVGDRTIRLLFNNVESIDVLIDRLQNIKSVMLEMRDGNSTTATEEKSNRVRKTKNRNTSPSSSP